jgi:TatD DNase family protein
MLIDTHCHLNHELFDGDVGATIARAKSSGVEKMIVIGFDLASSERAVSLSEQYPAVYAAVGIHPHDARKYDRFAEDKIAKLGRHPRVVAIGEIGLDYHYDNSPKNDQLEAFQAQLGLAHDLNLPVIIHCREAYSDTLDELEIRNGKELGGVMHCWGGNSDEAERALTIGLHLGFGGVLTFKNAEDIRQIAAQAPADRILLETDAPYLAPVPHRGKRNEPAYTKIVLATLCALRGEEAADMSAATTRNAERVFAKLV